MDSPLTRIKSHGDPKEFKARLEKDWAAGEVADITLVDGTEVSGVLIGISSSALVLDRWDLRLGSPADDPFTLELATVAEVVVP